MRSVQTLGKYILPLHAFFLCFIIFQRNCRRIYLYTHKKANQCNVNLLTRFSCGTHFAVQRTLAIGEWTGIISDWVQISLIQTH